MSRLLNALMDWSSSLEEPICVSFSGGMDSLLVALCSRKFTKVRCIVAGTPASDDVWHARRLKARFDLAVDIVEIDIRSYERHALAVAPLLAPANPMTLNLSVVMSAVAEAAGPSVVLTGMGADELFLGYRKYASHGAETQPDDLRRLKDVDVPRYDRIGSNHGVSFRHPFIELAGKFETSGETGKPEVREAMRAFGVPAQAIREKRAMQFGSGVSHLLKGISRSRGIAEKDLVLHYMEDKMSSLI